MYTKTSLKKIKKDDLVQMFLDQQAKNYDDKMENEKLKWEDDQMENTLASLNFYKECNEDLKEEIKKLKEHYEKTMSKEFGWGNAIMANMYEQKDIENEKLKEEINEWEEEVSSIQSVSESLEWDLKKEIEEVKEENQKLKEENEKLEKPMQGVQYSKGICDELSKQIKDLKEEIKKLKVNRN
tara:strand:+ start:55 stop:603 length:549 start_codon:yes stop_codon:yes gene_type:complete